MVCSIHSNLCCFGMHSLHFKFRSTSIQFGRFKIVDNDFMFYVICLEHNSCCNNIVTGRVVLDLMLIHFGKFKFNV